MYRLIPFSQIKENSTELIPEIAEDNIGLEEFLTYCVAYDIETFSSCGDVKPYISFIINEKTENILYNLCSLLINSIDVKDCLSVKLGSIKNNNICRIDYYDNDNISGTAFFIIITNYLKKLFGKEFNNKESIEDINKIVKFIGSYGFDNYLEIIKDIDLDSEDNSYMYFLTIHGSNYKVISDFQGKYFPNIIRNYAGKYYDDYSISYCTDDTKMLSTNKRLVRKK